MFFKEDVFHAESDPATLTDKLNQLAKVKVAAGAAAAGTVSLGDTAQAVIAVLANVTSTGSAAAKSLLVAATDYNLNAAKTGLTMVTDQSLNTLTIIYR